MTRKQLDRYFDKINKKRDELIKAQMLQDERWADCLRQEIDLLMDLCFCDSGGNLLYLGR